MRSTRLGHRGCCRSRLVPTCRCHGWLARHLVGQFRQASLPTTSNDGGSALGSALSASRVEPSGYDRAWKLLRAGVSHDDPNAIGVTRRHERDAAVGGRVGVPVTIRKGLCHVSQVGLTDHSPDEVLVADPARGVLGPGPASDQVDLEPVRCKQQGGPLLPKAHRAREDISVELDGTVQTRDRQDRRGYPWHDALGPGFTIMRIHQFEGGSLAGNDWIPHSSTMSQPMSRPRASPSSDGSESPDVGGVTGSGDIA